jgi:hypothetical protein
MKIRVGLATLANVRQKRQPRIDSSPPIGSTKSQIVSAIQQWHPGHDLRAGRNPDSADRGVSYGWRSGLRPRLYSSRCDITMPKTGRPAQNRAKLRRVTIHASKIGRRQSSLRRTIAVRDDSKHIWSEITIDDLPFLSSPDPSDQSELPPSSEPTPASSHFHLWPCYIICALGISPVRSNLTAARGCSSIFSQFRSSVRCSGVTCH